jgi:hypothetical protein
MMIHELDRRCFASLLAAAVLLPETAFAQAAPAGVADLNGQNPAQYYKRAFEMFRAGEKDAAVFVFYLGQLRFRTHLLARPELPQQGDPALFGSLTVVVGGPMNEYAFGNMRQLDRTLKAVLAYDRANPDRFTPPDQFPAAHRTQRQGMESFRKQMLKDAASIRAQRKANGLENRI